MPKSHEPWPWDPRKQTNKTRKEKETTTWCGPLLTDVHGFMQCNLLSAHQYHAIAISIPLNYTNPFTSSSKKQTQAMPRWFQFHGMGHGSPIPAHTAKSKLNLWGPPWSTEKIKVTRLWFLKFIMGRSAVEWLEPMLINPNRSKLLASFASMLGQISF